jgi:PRTRC genetic system protein C
MSVTTLPRIFKYDTLILEDPDPSWTPDEVREHYANVYQDLTQASIEGPATTEEGITYKFSRIFGTKGISVKEIAEGKKEPCFEKRIKAGHQMLSVMNKIGLAVDNPLHKENTCILPPSEAQGLI